jgi:SAM-dependent methyltransferase
VRSIPERYPGRPGRLYRRLRLHHGDYTRVARLLPREGLIVDLGAGAGLLAHVLLSEAPARRVLAVDHDPRRVATLAASAGGLPIEARVGDLSTFVPPPCRAVVLLDVLHYFGAPEQERILSMAGAALEEDGVLLLRDPDAGAGLRFLAAALHERIAVAAGLTRARIGRYRSGGEWALLLERLGFADVRPHALRRASPYADRILTARRPCVR